MRPLAKCTTGATAGEWRRVATTQTMHDGSVLPTWGIQAADTFQWVGKVHPIGEGAGHQVEAFANAGLFAASKAMAVLLEEAVQVWAEQFGSAGDDDGEVPGGDLLDWFAGWRLRAKAAVEGEALP